MVFRRSFFTLPKGMKAPAAPATPKKKYVLSSDDESSPAKDAVMASTEEAEAEATGKHSIAVVSAGS